MPTFWYPDSRRNDFELYQPASVSRGKLTASSGFGGSAQVKADLGHPPLVTPSSQIVGTQSVLNVLTGERYKMVTNEVKDYFRGLYGRPRAGLTRI